MPPKRNAVESPRETSTTNTIVSIKVGSAEAYRFLPSQSGKMYRYIRGPLGLRISPDLYKSVISGRVVIEEWEESEGSSNQEIAWYEPAKVTSNVAELLRESSSYELENLQKAALLSNLLG